MASEYQIPCRRTLGHGEACNEERLCGGCTEIKRLRGYWQAIDDEAVSTFTLDSSLSAKEQLGKIIEWHMQVATDPAVNGGQHLSDYPKSVTTALIALLDRIEIEDDHTLAGQRFDILEAAGFKVAFMEHLGDQTKPN